MSRSSTHKTFANLPVTFSPPAPDILPRYEDALNSSLRNFPDPEAQANNLQPFDKITEPSPKHVLTKKRRYILLGSLIMVVILIGILIVGLLSAKIAGSKLASTPLSTRETGSLVTITATQTTSVFVTVPTSMSTESPPPVVSATTLTTRTVAGPSSELFTSYTTVTSFPEPTSSSEILPPVVSATTLITRTAAAASPQVVTTFTTLTGEAAKTTFAYLPTTTVTSPPTPSSALQAKSITPKAAPPGSKSVSHTHRVAPGERLPSAPPALTTVAPKVGGNPIGLSLTTTATGLPSEGYLWQCGVPGNACDE
ncbi:hypothetical protein LTR53_011558 [Teratosphaeriaceae sp. CCFEE 6253]|nr:hypothetical protein LTR53_011558 [Teratosphaeriaceae sp. CCFEE 6253]